MLTFTPNGSPIIFPDGQRQGGNYELVSGFLPKEELDRLKEENGKDWKKPETCLDGIPNSERISYINQWASSPSEGVRVFFKEDHEERLRSSVLTESYIDLLYDILK